MNTFHNKVLKPILLNFNIPKEGENSYAIFLNTETCEELDYVHKWYTVVETDSKRESVLRVYYKSDTNTYDKYKIAYQLFCRLTEQEYETN